MDGSESVLKVDTKVAQALLLLFGLWIQAPASPNQQISKMVDETVKLAERFGARGWPILCFLDTHAPDEPEPPYPPHCIIGTGEEDLIAGLCKLVQFVLRAGLETCLFHGFREQPWMLRSCVRWWLCSHDLVRTQS